MNDILNKVESLFDYTISTPNRKKLSCTAELGLGICFIMLAIGTGLCEPEDNTLIEEHIPDSVIEDDTSTEEMEVE